MEVARMLDPILHRIWEPILHRVYLLLLGMVIVAAVAYLWAGHKPAQYQSVATLVVVPHLGNTLGPAEYNFTVKVAQEYEAAPPLATVVPTVQNQVSSLSAGQIQNELQLALVANQPVITISVKDDNAARAVRLAHTAAFALANAYTQQAVSENTSYANSVQALQSQVNTLAPQLAAAQTAAEGQGPSSAAATLLASLQAQYDTVSAELASAQKAWNAHPLVYFVVGADASPAKVTSLSREDIALFGALIGLFAGIAFALLFDFFDSTVRTPPDISRFTKLKTIGTVRALTLVDDPQAVMRPDQYAEVAPSYAEIARNIQFLGLGRRLQTVLVCPTKKTPNSDLFATNLAITLAQTSVPTLLIDLNYQSPVLQTRFALPNTMKGIFTALLQASTFPGEAFVGVVPSPIEKLDLLPLGPVPPNPSDLLRASVMDRLLAQLRQQYHYIIVLAPSTLDSPGGRELVESVDGTIVAATAGITHRAELTKLVETLQRLHANVVGAAIITNKPGRQAPVRASVDQSGGPAAPKRGVARKASTQAQSPNIPVATTTQQGGRHGAGAGSHL